MSFFRKMADTFRAVNEGRATAQAHQMAEQLLGERLPADVAQDGYALAARMADYSTVEQMAMVYVTTYANRMSRYLDAVNATQEFRTRVARAVARAFILLRDLHESGTRFDEFSINDLIAAAKKHGVNTDSGPASFSA